MYTLSANRVLVFPSVPRFRPVSDHSLSPSDHQDHPYLQHQVITETQRCRILAPIHIMYTYIPADTSLGLGHLFPPQVYTALANEDTSLTMTLPSAPLVSQLERFHCNTQILHPSHSVPQCASIVSHILPHM